MTLNKTLLALALGLSLTACNGLNTKTQQIEASCAVAAAANNTIAAGVRHGQVSKAQQDAAIAANDYIYPICDRPTPPTMDAVKQAAFDKAVAKLLEIRETVR